MRRKHRIILILFIGAFVGTLVIALSLPGREDGVIGEHGWSRLESSYDSLLVKLHLRHKVSAKDACIKNLEQINGEKATWVLKNKKPNTDIPTATDPYGTANYIRDPVTAPGDRTLNVSVER